MSNTQEERIDKAVVQLVERQFAPYPNEDEASADERFENLLESARNTIDSQDDAAVAADVNHASDLIKKKRKGRDVAVLKLRTNQVCVQLFARTTLRTRHYAFPTFIRDSYLNLSCLKSGRSYTFCTSSPTEQHQNLGPQKSKQTVH